MISKRYSILHRLNSQLTHVDCVVFRSYFLNSFKTSKMSTLNGGSLLEVLKAKMQQSKDELENVREEAVMKEKMFQEEKRKREEAAPPKWV